jgi:hypothetical protein
MKEALPVELAPDTVNLLRRQRMERNRLNEPIPQTWSKMTQLWGGGYYPEFEFMPEEYDRKNEFARQAREETVQKRLKICARDWSNASQEARLKHESLIDIAGVEKDLYPYLSRERNLDAVPYKSWLRVGMDCHSGASWGQGRGQLPPESVSFLAGKNRGLEDNSIGSRMMLPTIVQRMQRRMDLDWEGTTVVVSATDQDLVQVAFHMATVDSERGVQAYMGVLSKDDELLGSLGLRKLSQLWGMQRDFSGDGGDDGRGQGSEDSYENTWMFFLFCPKWVRMRPTDAYYTVHPRQGGYAFRMSSAGSSVLLSAQDSSGTAGQQRSSFTSSALAKESPREPPRSSVKDALSSAKVDLSMALKAASGLPPIRETRGGGAHTAR